MTVFRQKVRAQLARRRNVLVHPVFERQLRAAGVRPDEQGNIELAAPGGRVTARVLRTK